MTADAYVGPRGDAVNIDWDRTLKGTESTVCCWLLSGPWHPFWPQFLLAVLSLAEIPGVAPPNLRFPGATHELIVVALKPPGEPTMLEPRAVPRHSVETIQAQGMGVGYLQPVDVCEQFTATDDEMRELAELLAQACTSGLLTPSTDDAREFYREQWLTACVRTLAHMRGEEHAP